MILNLFKASYRDQRKTGKLYNGFGLWHKDDVSEYFVHDNNEGYNKRTYVSQAIGEAVIFYSENILAEMNGAGSYIKFKELDVNTSLCNIILPEEWIFNEVFINNVSAYKIRYSEYENKIDVNLFGKNGIIKDYKFSYYDYLPLFVTILYFDCEKSGNIKYLAEKFVFKRNISDFVVLCESFYQLHKLENYIITNKVIKEKI